MAKVYHLSKITQSWEELETGLLTFEDNLDDEGVTTGHSVVVYKPPAEDPLQAMNKEYILRSSLQPPKMYARE